MSTKIILDTDIDILGDIDDAACLAYLLSQPACEILGITTVSFDTEQRAMVASAMCKAAGRDVPIFPGAAAPLLRPLPVVTGVDADQESVILDRWQHERTFPRGQAVEFMRQTIRAHPGEVTLLAVGPLTNVALLFTVDPEIPHLLEGLVLMCGRFTHSVGRSGPLNPSEWNAAFDPHATAIVYRSPVRLHRSVGLDVTEELTLDGAQFQARFRPGRAHPLQDFAAAWFHGRETITFHDPLAAAVIFDDQICRFERGAVEVELVSDKTPGTTYWNGAREEASHEVALEVDGERFFAHYFDVFR